MGIDRGEREGEKQKKRRESDTMAFVKEIKNKAYFKRFQVKLKRRRKGKTDYKGLQEASGEDYLVEENDDGPRPFFCLLDVGLKRTSTGSKVFAALKGALDGGLDIPHSDKRYVGYDPESKSLDEDTLRKYIFGGHVADYMESMKAEDPDAYAKHFSCFIKEGIEASALEGIYKKVHAAIRAKPVAPKKAKKVPATKKKWQAVKKTYEQRKSDLAARIASIKAE